MWLLLLVLLTKFDKSVFLVLTALHGPQAQSMESRKSMVQLEVSPVAGGTTVAIAGHQWDPGTVALAGPLK